MSMSSLLAASLKSTTADDQGSWRQYVLDHLDYIANKTTATDIGVDLMNRYRYDLARFIKEDPRLARRQEMAWIVLLLNNMTSDLDFVEPGIYLIPTDDTIQKLYHSYITIESNQS